MQLLTDLWSKGSVEELVKDVLGAVSIWNEDLNNIPGLHNRVVYYINNIMEHGMLETVKGLVAGN